MVENSRRKYLRLAKLAEKYLCAPATFVEYFRKVYFS